MATRTIGTKVNLSGESEYKNAIKEINSGLSVLNSEMRKTTAEFQDNANSMEALRAKSDVLERQMISQKEKVEKLKEALAASAEKYGEADARTMKWQKQLNEAEAQLFNTEAAIRKNNAAMEAASEGTSKLGGLVTNLSKRFGVELPEEISTAMQSIGGFSTAAVAAFGMVAASVTEVIDIEKKLISTTTEAASRADDILTESLKTGLSTDSIQQMKYAAELLDVSFETISGSLTKLKRNMYSAKDGNRSLCEAFASLGINITNMDGSLRNAEDVFYEAIDALGYIENVTERDAVAMEIFGKSAQELNPLIIQGSDALREFGEEAQSAGYVMSGEMLDSLGEVDNQYQRMLNTQEAVRNHLAEEFAPAMSDTYTEWANMITKVGKALADSGLIKDLGIILESTIDIMEPLGTLISDILPALNLVLEPIAGLFAWIADTVQVVMGMLTLDFNKIGVALGYGAKYGEYSNMQKWMGMDTQAASSGSVYDSTIGAWRGNAFNAPGDMNYAGGATWVGENGPERVWLPKGSVIENNQDSRTRSGDVFNITIDAKNVREFNDVVRVAKSKRQLARMGG